MSARQPPTKRGFRVQGAVARGVPSIFMTPKALQRFALSLPEAHEEPHFERTSFRVGKKIFATMTPDGSEAMIRVSQPELVRSLLAKHEDVFFSYGAWTTQNGSLGVRLAKANPKMIEDLVVESWKQVAPKRAAAEYSARPRTAMRRRSP
jgi:hypothetical protein